ncbi:MAG: hypothetical protein L0287_35005 [Anaerolineae bacterium]|nr:hypothetical protein [Anaerolineae bacterium]
MRDKVWIREQFLQVIDKLIADMQHHSIKTTGEIFPEYDLMVNQRNRVAVFLGESKHRYTIRRNVK